MVNESDWIAIKIKCKSAKIRHLAISKIYDLCFSDDFLDDKYIEKLKDKPELNISSSLRYDDGVIDDEIAERKDGE